MLVTGRRRGTLFFRSAGLSLWLWPRGRALRSIPSFRNSPPAPGRARTALGAGIGRTGRTNPTLTLTLECTCDMVALGTTVHQVLG